MKTRDEIFEAAAQARRLRASGRGLDQVLTLLRTQGFRLAASAEVVRLSEDIGLAEAKAAVVASPVWEDRRERRLRTEDMVTKAVSASPGKCR